MDFLLYQFGIWLTMKCKVGSFRLEAAVLSILLTEMFDKYLSKREGLIVSMHGLGHYYIPRRAHE